MVKKGLLLFSLLLLSFVIGLPEIVNGQAGETSKSNVIQSQETEFSGIVAELIECKRKEGVLTIKVVFRNTGEETTHVYIDTGHGDYSGIYVTADSKKYFVLKDSEKVPLAPKEINGDLNKGGKLLWWAKYPAPPAEVKKINLIMPQILPFEDVPITD